MLSCALEPFLIKKVSINYFYCQLQKKYEKNQVNQVNIIKVMLKYLFGATQDLTPWQLSIIINIVFTTIIWPYLYIKRSNHAYLF
jgi:hypothetical protein